MKRPRFTDHRRWGERGLVFGLTILYLLAFPFLHSMVGDSATAFSVLPVAAAGWYFGLWSGFIASLVAILINAVFLASYAGMDFTILAHREVIPGLVTLVTVGAVAGRVGQFLQERKRVEAELRRRERDLSLLNEMTRTILAAEDFTSTLQSLANGLARLVEADDCYVTRWDAERQLTVSMTTTVKSEPPYTREIFEQANPNMTASVMKAGRALAADDVFNSPYVNPVIAKQYPARSLLGIPLIFGEHKLGAALIAFNTPHHFTEEEIQRAETVGAQISILLWNAQQDAGRQRLLRESNALAKIGRALSKTERVGLDEVLQLIVDSARELIPAAQQAVIHLLDAENQLLIPRAVTGFQKTAGRDSLSPYMRLGEGVAGQVIAEGVGVNIADVEQDPRFLRLESRPRFRSLLVSPVQSGTERMGTISVQSADPYAFRTEELQLLTSLGTQAAIAIENARLLEATQKSLKEVNALYHITRGLVATLDSAELMSEAVNLLQQNFGYYQVQILVSDPETDEMIVHHGSGAAADKLEGSRLPAGAGIIGHAAETGEPFFTNDVDEVVFYFPHPQLPETKSELAVPIKVGRRVLGVLDIQQSRPALLSEHDLKLVRAVADQLAVSLQKASLYSDLQTALEQEKTTRAQLVQSERLALVGRLLASVSHELNNPLQAIQNALFLLKDDPGLSEQGRQDLQIILSETERMAALIERLRTSYRPTRLSEFRPVQINAIVEDVYALIATHLRHKEIAFEFHPQPDLPLVSGLPDQLRQVILNLLMNAVDAITTGGRLTVATERAGEQEILLTVSDSGPGIDPLLLPHIFDAFVTNKDSGTGLGLTITYDIVHRHNGRIQAMNNPNGGATFNVWLPTLQTEQT